MTAPQIVSQPRETRGNFRSRKQRGLDRWQLLLVAGFLIVVGLSFGQNVLSTRGQLGLPKRLGEMELVKSVKGAEALAQINRLHGTDIKLVSAYIAEYAHGSVYHPSNERVTIWVGRAESSSDGAELTQRMLQAITKGGSPFSAPQQLAIAGHEVVRVEGAGGEHFFYNSAEQGESVVWVTIENSGNALAILETLVKTL